MSESKDAADSDERTETDEHENLELLAKLRTWFENAEDASAEARAAAEMARDYYDGEQLTEEEIATLKARGQPIMVANRIKPKINYLRGMEKKSRMDPKAYPRNPGDEEAAQAATDSLRYVVDAEVFDQTASMVWDNQLIEGFGGADVIVEDDGERGPRIRVIHYRFDRLFYDPHSSSADFTDGKFLGGMIWADEDDIEADWPDADENAIKGAYEYADTASGKTFDDKPRGSTWADYKRKRLRVIQMHWTKGREWWLATFTAGGFLSKPAKSPYLDERGNPECSLIMQSGYVDRNNNRYGAVKDMIGPQDEINKRRSKALHLLTMRQVVAETGAVQDVDSARAELAKPDGYIEIAPQSKFEVVQTSDLAAGQFQLLQEAKSELEAVGPNATMQGRQGGSASGRAIALTQQGGAIEVDGALLDQHRAWKHRIYRAIWNRIKQYWTAEKWIRVTEKERNAEFVGLNRPMTYADALEQAPPEQQQAAMQQMQMRGISPDQPVIDQQGKPVLVNNVGELDVDIVLDESPDVATLQIEQFQKLGELFPVIAQAMPPLVIPLMEMLIEASSLKNKDRLLDKIEELQQPQQQAQGPDPAMLKMQADAQAQQAQFGLDQQKAQADIALQQRKQQADMALAMQKQRGELAIKAASMRGSLALKQQQAAMAAFTRPPPRGGNTEI